MYREVNEIDDQQTKVSEQHSKQSKVTSIHLACGQDVGPFKILSVLGEGGMGTVYLGEQFQPIHRKVAIKVARNGTHDSDIIARFHGERQAIASLDHPEIAKLLEVGTTPQGLPFFAMELINGTVLTTFCDKNSLTINQRLLLFQKACSAIGYAHRRGLIHRDLKPSNILVEQVGDEFRLKIIDFGLAKFVENPHGDASFTVDGQVTGTPRYMSPEQASGSKSRLDIRSDVFSLGVILFELLTGSTPIPEDDSKGVLQVLKEVSDFEPVIPSSRLSTNVQCKTDPDISSISEKRSVNVSTLISLIRGDLDWIVTKATDPDQERRYFSCDELSDDIDRFLNHEPINARPPSLSYQMWKFARKNRAVVVSAVTVITILFVSLITGWYLALWALNQSAAEKIATKNATDAMKKAENALRLTKKAKEEVKTAEVRAAMSFQMLTDSFDSLDPASSGRSLSAGDALWQTFLNSKRVMKDDPVGRANLFSALAKSLNGLGKNNHAKKVISEALNILEQEYGELAPELLPARTILQDILMSTKKGELFKIELAKSKNIAQQNNMKSSYFWLKCHVQEAKVKLDSADTSTMQAGFDQFVELIPKLKKVDKKYRREILAYQSEFASVAFWIGAPCASHRILEDVLTQQIQLLGSDHPSVLLTKIRLIRIKLPHDENRQSVVEIEKTVDNLANIYGESHPDLLLIQGEFAKLCNEDLQTKKAEELCKKLIPRFSDAFGSHSEYTLRLHHTYAESLLIESKQSEAQKIMESIVPIWKSKFKNNWYDISHAESLLAKSYSLGGRTYKAIKLYKKLVGNIDEPNFRFNKVIDDSILALAELHINSGSLAKSMTYGKVLLKHRRPGFQKAQAHYLLGYCQFKNGNFAEARKNFQSAKDFTNKVYERSKIASHGRMNAGSLYHIGQCYYKEGKREVAIRYLEEAILYQKNFMKSELPILRDIDVEYLVDYLNSLFWFSKYNPTLECSLDFVKEYEELYNLLRKHLGIDSYQTLKTVERFTGVLMILGEVDRAIEISLEYETIFKDVIQNYNGKDPQTLHNYHTLNIQGIERTIYFYILQKKREAAKKTHERLILAYKNAFESFSGNKKYLLKLRRLLKDSKHKKKVLWFDGLDEKHGELEKLVKGYLKDS